MKSKIVISIISIITIFIAMGGTQKVLAKEDIKLETGNEYDEFQTYEELRAKGEFDDLKLENPETIKEPLPQTSNQNNNRSMRKARSTTQYEDIKYTTPQVSSSYTENVYVPKDIQNDYFIEGRETLGESGEQYYEIYKHNIKENTNTAIYKSKDKCHMIAVYSRENIIYVEEAEYTAYDKGDWSKVTVIGVNVNTNKVVYEGTFALGSVRKEGQQRDYFPSFAVDSKQRFYFIYNFTGMRIFDNKGKMIYDKTPPPPRSEGIQDEIRIHSITPNDEGIIFTLGHYSWPPYAYFSTDRTGFQRLNADGTFVIPDYLINSISPFGDSYIEAPDWKFIDSKGVYAVNQYGQIAKFNYTSDRVRIESVDDSLRRAYDAHMGYLFNPAYIVKNNYLYLLGANSYIFIYDMNKNFERVGRINTKVPEAEDYMTEQISRITIIDNYLYIKCRDSSNKAIERKISVNEKEDFENIWYTEHVTQSHTQRQIIDKYKQTSPKFDYTKNQFSVNPSSKAPYVAGKLQNQVVTDTINQINYYRWLYGVNEVTVNTEKLERNQKGAVIQAANNKLSHYPSKPSDMSKEFYDEAYAGCNASYQTGDSYNGNCSMGDRSTTHSIEGYISDLNNVSIDSYIGHRLNLLDLGVTKASFGYCNGYTTLSMFYGDTSNKEQFYAYPSAGNFPMQSFVTDEYWHLYCMDSHLLKEMKIQFIYNNKTYKQSEYVVEGASIVFKMPDELINVLGGKGKQMPTAEITVQLVGLKNSIGNTVNYKYDVNFFDVNQVMITGISFTEKEQMWYAGAPKTAQTIKVVPSNATEKCDPVWTSSNQNVATIDKKGKITCKSVGTTVITAKFGDLTASYTLNIKQAPQYTIGHVNDDGKVNTLDAVKILQYVAKKIKLTDAQMLAADTNRDGKVNTLDAVKILQYVAKKITKF